MKNFKIFLYIFFLLTITNRIMSNDLPSIYINLIEHCLLDDIYGATDLNGKPVPSETVNEGLYWPLRAHTMIGVKRIKNIEELFKKVLLNSIPGDLMECGVWRGGATILMRALLEAYNIKDRRVWVADSFEGLPRPNPTLYPADNGDGHHAIVFLNVGLEQVKQNFKKYGLLDDQVIFVKGFFKNSLPNCRVEKLAILRLDGDMYESTIQCLDALYNKVSTGGYIIIDDYALKGARLAVDDFRKNHKITASLIKIDYTGVYWQK